MFQLLALPLALAGGHASLHPADSSLYFEVSDLPALKAAYEQAPLVQLLSDPVWNGFAARALEEDPETFRLTQWCTEYLEASLDGVASIAGTDIDLRNACEGLRAFSLSISAPELSWSLEEALAEPANEGVAIDDYLARVGAVLILDYADAESARRGVEFCVGALQLIPAEVQHKQAPLSLLGQEGLVQEYRHTVPGALPPIWSATCGGSVILGLGTQTPDRWRALADQRSAQLAGNARFAAGIEERSDEAAVPIYDAFMDLSGVTDVIDVIAHYGELQALADWASALTYLLPNDAYTTRRRTHLRGDRFVYESVSSGLRVLDGVGVAPAEQRALEFLPPGTMGSWVTSVRPEDFEPLLLEMVADWLASDVAEAQRFLTEDVGIDVQADLLEPLGTAAAVYLMPFAGPTLPEFGVVIALDDGERLRASLDKLFGLVEERWSGTLDSRSGKYRGQAVYSAASKTTASSWGLPDLGPANMILDLVRPGVAIAVLDDRVLISLERRFVTREVKRVASPEEGVPANALAAAKSQFPAETTCVSMLDCGAGLGSLYEMVRTLAPMLGSGALPFDVDSLPPTESLTRHFRPSLSWSLPVAGGTRSYAESSFGPESTIIVAALAGLFVYENRNTLESIERPVTVPVEPAPPAVDPEAGDH